MTLNLPPAPVLARAASWGENLKRGNTAAVLLIHRHLPLAFVVLAGVMGLTYAAMDPPFQSPDEPAHLNRAFSVAEGHFVASALTPVPNGILQMESSFAVAQWPAKRDTARDVKVWFQYPASTTVSGIANAPANVYSWIPYLPAAAAIRVAESFGAGPLPLLYEVRLTNLAVFLFLSYLAMVILQQYRLLLFALAAMPMTLYQAASCSADAVTNGVAFLFIAYVLRIAMDPELRLTRKQVVWLMIGAGVCAQLKLNILLMPLVFLIPVERFSSSRVRWVVVALVVSSAVLSAEAWHLLNSRNETLLVAERLTRGVDLHANEAFIKNHPARVYASVERTVSVLHNWLPTTFVGYFGWLSVGLPVPVMREYLLLLLLSITFPLCSQTTIHQRIVLIATFILAFLGIELSMFVSETKLSSFPALLNDTALSVGVQGRYFISFSMPLFVALAFRRFRLAGTLVAFAVLVLWLNAQWAAVSVLRGYFWSS